jgi:hypothetical protein
MGYLRLRWVACSAAAAAALLVPALLAPGGVSAKKKRGTSISFNKWKVENGVSQTVSPNSTVTHCASERVSYLEVSGVARHLVTGKKGSHRRIWTHNGATVEKSGKLLWRKARKKAGYSGSLVSLEPEGFGDGTWTFKVVQRKKTIGRSSVVLVSDPSC